MRLALHPWSVVEDNHYAGLTLTWQRRDGRTRCVMIGFGWDNEQPLRPWPSLVHTPTPAGNLGWCLTWCGLFINVRTSPQ